MYGVIRTPSYRRIRCFLTVYAVIYVLLFNIQTFLQNVMMVSVRCVYSRASALYVQSNTCTCVAC